MDLWNPLNRAMAIAAGISVLAACYAVAAWGQGGLRTVAPTCGTAGGLPVAGPQLRLGNWLSGTPTVSVAELRIPAAAWRHFAKAKNAAEKHRDAEFERESAMALEIAPNFTSMYILRATVQMGARQYQEALASAQAANLAGPGAMWTTVVLAGAYNGLHRFKDALLVLDANHGFEAETWQAMYEHARASIGTGDIAGAMHWSGMALNAAPRQFIDAHLVRANALVLAGRWVEAESEMDVYLQSKMPKLHTAEVVALRSAVEARIAAEREVDARALLRLAAGLPVTPQMASR